MDQTSGSNDWAVRDQAGVNPIFQRINHTKSDKRCGWGQGLISWRKATRESWTQARMATFVSAVMVSINMSKIGIVCFILFFVHSLSLTPWPPPHARPMVFLSKKIRLEEILKQSNMVRAVQRQARKIEDHLLRMQGKSMRVYIQIPRVEYMAIRLMNQVHIWSACWNHEVNSCRQPSG